MKFAAVEPPREFSVGRAEIIQLRDCARINLEPNEQVTFVTASGAELDVVKKSWGFYATPSLNGRLAQFGLRALLARSPTDRYFILLVERGKEAELQAYLSLENHKIVSWLDTDDALAALARALER
jgi:hypothetical protein